MLKIKKSILNSYRDETVKDYEAQINGLAARPKGKGNLSKKQAEVFIAAYRDGTRDMLTTLILRGVITIED